MKKIIMLSAAAIGLAALTPAKAASPFHTVTLSATIPTSCTVTGTPTVVSGAFSGASQLSSAFTVNVTGTTANVTSGELSVGTINCTSSQMKVTLTPDGWIRNGGSEITYSAYLKNGSTILNSGNALVTSGSGTGPKFVNFTGTTLNLGLQISTNQATSLVAGTYTGTLAISVDPI